MVILSGGDFGGSEYAGDGWVVGEEKVIGGLIYRRISDTQAVFVGAQ